MSTACTSITSKFELKDLNTGVFYFQSGAVNVLGFNVSFGIGDNASTLSLDITGDPNCDGNVNVTAPDVGVPVLFRSLAGEFYFGGIVGNISYSEGSTGYKYTLKIVDPTKLLSNVTVLLKNYYCEIKDCFDKKAKNFINAAYMMEGKDCALCPPGEDFEDFPKMKDCSKFGTSGVELAGPRNHGVSLEKLFTALQANDVEVYTTHPSDDRLLRFDFSELIAKLKQRGRYAKTNSDHENLASLIDTAAGACACDYIATIEPNGKIKIWLLDRSSPVPMNVIPSIINAQKNTKKNVISSSYGVQEIYDPAHKVIIGDNIAYLRENDVDFESTDDRSEKTVYMFFGYSEPSGPNNTVEPITIKPKDFTNNGVEINIGPLADMFAARKINIARKIKVTEQEMLHALKSQTLWMLYGLSPKLNQGKTSLSKIICDAVKITAAFDLQKLINAIDLIYENNGPPNQVPFVSQEEAWKNALKLLLISNGPAAKEESYILFEEAWTWFQNFINSYYGKKFLVSAGDLCIFPDPQRAEAIIPGASSFKKSDGGFYELSDVPQDAGFPSKNQIRNGIKGLFYPKDTAFFETSDGKINGFVVIDLEQARAIKFKENVFFGVALQEMSSDSYYSKNIAINNQGRATGKAYVKITVENEVFISKVSKKAFVMINLNSSVALTPDFCRDANGAPQNINTCANKFLTIGLKSMAAIFGKDKLSARGNGKGYANISEFNTFSLGNATGSFLAVVLPMKSMYYSYGRNKNSCGGIDGPFVGSKGVVGGTDIIIDKDLNPWSYGGYDQMEFVGTQLALNGIRANNLEETGEMQIAEPPAYSSSYYIRTYKLIIQGINVSYSATGVTTTYTFSTKTPRFANYAESIANQIKKVKEARQEVNNFINDIKRKTVSDINTLYKNIFQKKAERFSSLTEEKTPTALILGGYFDIKTENNTEGGGDATGDVENKSFFTCDELCEEPTEPPPPTEAGSETKQRTYDVGIDKIVNGSLQIAFTGDEYKTQIMMSMDGILAPVSIKGRIGTDNRHRAPRYFDSWEKNSTTPPISLPRPPMPPLDLEEKISINQRYLNPILSTKILIDWDSRKGNTEKGSCIQFLSFNEDPKDLYDDDKREQADDFGFFSLRGPLVLQSWGYDTEGKPIPNAADSPDQAEKGIFTNKGLRNTFMDHWTKNPMTWPVGPIDLRFDRTRGVWVSPAQTERVLVAQLVETLGPYGSAKAILLNPSAGGLSYFQNYEIWGPEGENLFANLRNIKINVYDFLGRSLCANTKVYIVNVDGRYIVIESSAAGDETCTEEECECTTETETTETTETTEETTEETTDEPTDEPTTDEPPTDETCPPCSCPESPPVETAFMFASMLMSNSDPNCSNVCGLAECIGALGSGPGVLGIDENGCLTLYCTPDCTPTIGEIEF